jgi:hypothetical protein
VKTHVDPNVCKNLSSEIECGNEVARIKDARSSVDLEVVTVEAMKDDFCLFICTLFNDGH